MTIVLHSAFWLVLLIINVLLFSWITASNQLITRALVNILFLAFLFYFNALVLVNRYLEEKKYFTYFLLANALIWLFVPLRVKVNLLFPVIHEAGASPNPEVQFKGLVFGALATNLCIVMFSTIYQVLVNRYAAERQTLEIINQQNEAQLQFLRAQINPHFLFNTLNNIYSLAVVRSPKTADMVLKLSQLLRYVTYDSQEQKVPLEREVEHIRRFIELFQMRSEEPADVNFQVSGALPGVAIEPMILIPIVENCFKHCDFDTNEKAFVKMNLRSSGNEIVFETQNSKNDADRQKDHTGGVGLENIRRRLELLYPGRFSFVSKDETDRFEVVLTLKTT